MKRTFIITIIAVLVTFAVSTEVCRAQQSRPLLVVRNASPFANGAVLISVYVIPTDDPGNWGADLLGSIVVGPQSTIGIFLTPSKCMFDVRLVFDNGFSAERRRVNACAKDNIVEINAGVATPPPQGNVR